MLYVAPLIVFIMQEVLTVM